MKIFATGLSGLVGSRVLEILKDNFEFENSSEDVTKPEISEKIGNSKASVVLHIAAKANVDACEEDKDLGEKGDAWKVNVLGTKNVAEACAKYGKKLIYISTDFVFDGEKQGIYNENDTPNPINWYAKTKYEGEKAIQSLSLDYIIARIAYPYRASFERMDFARKLKEVLENRETVNVISDHIMTPTFIDDIAYALETLIKSEQKGVFHVVGSQNLRPYDCAVIICDIFGLDKKKIAETTREEFFKNRAPRPFNLAISNDKIQRIGIRMKTFEEGIREIKKQIS